VAEREAGLAAEVELTVRYAETDQMGFVHHSNYLIWFEAARTRLFQRLGLTYSQLESEGIYSPVVAADAKYLWPARYEDLIRVVARLDRMTAARVRFNYEVYRVKDDKLLATGSTMHGFIDQAGRPLAIKKRIPLLWEAAKQAGIGSGS
jgi:acyl-CoA thioester hydrolase